MKVKVIKPIKISEVGKTVLPLGHECEISDSAGQIFVDAGYVEEIEGLENAKDVIEKIKTVTVLTELDVFRSDTRTTVVKALEKRESELKG